MATKNTKDQKVASATGNGTAKSATGASNSIASITSNRNGGFKVSDNTNAIDAERKKAEANEPGAFTYNKYSKSDAVLEAEARKNEHISNKPGELQFSWMSTFNDTLDKIFNREPFSYDLNGDALYQQYKNQYTLQGQQASMDTMGQAQAMTGGYGNSYAQTVGQQTYQGYLQQLNDKVPELYQLALDKYYREGEELYNQYGLLSNEYDREYGMYQDKLSNYYKELDYLTQAELNALNFDYENWWNTTNLNYNINSDKWDRWAYGLNRLDQNYNTSYGNDWNEYTYNTDNDWRKYTYETDNAWNKYTYETDNEISNQQRNYSNLVTMMTTFGYEPTAEELAAAGISPEMATAILNTYNEQNTEKKAKNPQANPAGDTGEKLSYGEIKAKYLAIRDAGNQRDADEWLKLAVEDGWITMDQATEIRDRRN